MIKTCVCGNILNDSKSPNDFVYRLYSENEGWEINKRRYLDYTYRNEFIIKQAWYCKKCQRVHSMFKMIDEHWHIFNLFKTTALSNQQSYKDYGEDFEVFYAMNDFDDSDMAKIVRTYGTETTEYRGYKIKYYNKKHAFLVLDRVQNLILEYRIEI